MSKKHHSASGAAALASDRRKLLGYMGGTAAGAFIGDVHGQSVAANRSAAPLCIAKPEQTEGPYFIDEKLRRDDIRSDPEDGTVRPGLPLRLTLRLAAVTGAGCQPLAGAVVDVWHGDARGEYSDVRDRQYDNRGRKFLRGYQVSDANGEVRFTTIYPGWYPGRTVHIHFKVRTDPDSRRGAEFTSQLYFDDALTDQVHRQPPYADHGQRSMRNGDDSIFRRGGDELLLQLSRADDGYAGIFDLGLDTD